jgi:hypothetical protein
MSVVNTKDLLKIVSEKSDPDQDRAFGAVEKWVIDHGVREGTYKADCLLIYHTYATTAKRPLGYREFFKQFNQLFTQRKSTFRYYRLDPTPFDTSKEMYFKLRAEFRKMRKKGSRTYVPKKEKPKKRL